MAGADTSIFHKISVLRFAQEEMVTIHGGTLDLTHLGNREYFHVNGNIQFIPNEFVEARYMDEAAFQQLLVEKKAIETPLRLKTNPDSMKGTDATYGTFVIRVRNDRSRRLAINVPRFFHPAEITFVDSLQNRRLIIHGKLNETPERNGNFNELSSPVAVIEADQDFYLYAKASGPLFNGKNTLNFSAFYIGEESYLNRLIYMTRFYATLIAGTLLIIFVFYFFIFTFRPQDRSSFYLCIYALCSFALSLLYLINMPLNTFNLLSTFTIINLISIAFLQCFLLEKLAFLWSKSTHWKMISACVFVAGVASIGIITRVYSLVAVFFIISFLSSTVLIFSTFYLGIKHRLSGITFFLLGAILNSAFQVPIMMNYILNANTELGYNIMMANFSMVLSLALVNAKEFAVTYRKSVQQSETLEEKNKEITFFNKNLEKLVDHKTREVRALLDYIPQGVLSLTQDGMISKDFSAHLVHILGTDVIGQQSFKTLVLDRCEMSSDQRDQIWQSILSIVGEEEFNFEANAGKLPLEMSYRGAKDEKFLRARPGT